MRGFCSRLAAITACTLLLVRAPLALADPRRDALCPRGEAALFGLAGIPSHKADASASVGFGIDTGIGFGQLPFTLGVDFMAAYNGTTTTALSVPVGNDYFTLNWQRKTRTLFFDLWLRAQPQSWVVRPYLEGAIGTALLQTEETLSFVRDSNGTGALHDEDWVTTFGWGAGADFWGLVNADGSVSLTLGFRRASSGAVVYERTVAVGGAQQPLRYETNTSMTTVMLGFGGRIEFSGPPPRNPRE